MGVRVFLAVALLGASLSSAMAAQTCSGTAADKKLSGAAKTSFLGKCQRDAQSSCDAAAGAKKLAGAAKASFTKKCIKDAVGS